MPESLATLIYRIGQVEKDMNDLEQQFIKMAERTDQKIDGLRRVLMGLIVTIASGSVMIVITLALTGRAG